MTVPRLAEARERLLSRCRLIVQGYLDAALTVADAATGRTAAGRTTPRPNAVFAGVSPVTLDWIIGQTPVISIIEAGGDVRQENIHGTQDEDITLALVAMCAVDRANIEDDAQTARMLALCAADMLAQYLAEPLNVDDMTCWVCEVTSSAPDEPQQVGDDVWLLAYTVELHATIRYARGYSPLAATGLELLPARESDRIVTGATVTATGSGVAGTACAAGSGCTITLSAAQLAATTALTLTWAASTWSTATCYVMRQTAPAAAVNGSIAADAYAAPVGSVPLADGVEILAVAQSTTTQAAVTYRITIQVV